MNSEYSLVKYLLFYVLDNEESLSKNKIEERIWS